MIIVCVDIISVMANDVLSVVLLYVKPSDLPSFFINNNLNMHRSFKYSAFGIMLRIYEVRKMFHRFPNMILLGLSITYDDVKVMNFNDMLVYELHKLVNLEIIGIGISNTFTYFDSCIFTKCVNIKNVIINNMKICEGIRADITLCKNIRSIQFTNCVWDTPISFITYLPRLRAVKFTTEKIIEGEMAILQKCPKLRMLEIVNRLKYFFECVLPITHLKINPSINQSSIYLSEFNIFPKLRFLDLSYCEFKVYVDKVSYKLRGLNVVKCKVIICRDENVLRGLQYFRADNSEFIHL